MSVKEEADIFVSLLLNELGRNQGEYKFYIPDWEPQNLDMATRWVKSQIWEGFRVSYEVNQQEKSVRLNSWEEDFD